MKAMIALRYTDSQRGKILCELQAAGLCDSLSSKTLRIVTNDLNENSASAILIEDFGISPLVAHQTRAALQYSRNLDNDDSAPASDDGSIGIEEEEVWRGCHLEGDFNLSSLHDVKQQQQPWISEIDSPFTVPQFTGVNVESTLYPWKIHMELYEFLRFMIGAEALLNTKTAVVYLRYVKLFLSWYYNFFLPRKTPNHNVT